MSKTIRNASFTATLAVALVLAPACGGSNPTELFPSSMTAVGSSTITAKAGTQVTVQVKVLSQKGDPVSRTPVIWTPAQGDVLPSNSITDASGIATTQWTLSPVVGQQSVTATTSFVSPVTFTATATQ
jgi:hypothetical protein